MFPYILHNVVTALQVIIFASILLELVVKAKSHPIVRFISRVSDWLLMPARRLFSMLGLGANRIDWTPLFTIFALNFLEALIMRLLYG